MSSGTSGAGKTKSGSFVPWPFGKTKTGDRSPVVGAKYPPLEAPGERGLQVGFKSGGLKPKRSTFEEYNRNTLDVWSHDDYSFRQLAPSPSAPSVTKLAVDGDGGLQPVSSAPSLSMELQPFIERPSSDIGFKPRSSGLTTSPKARGANSRVEKFKRVLSSPNVDLEELRANAWSGIPCNVRPVSWKLLSGYLPANASRREATLSRKRSEYSGFIALYWEVGDDSQDRAALKHQIELDVPRMGASVPLVMQQRIQLAYERILYIWAVRHPASGYVQGINDLVTPFFTVFLQPYINGGEDILLADVSDIPEETMLEVEADTFWCLSRLLQNVMDHYTFAQPGIQRKLQRMQELMARVDAGIHQHLAAHGVEYMQFVFRWFNCLLIRELPLACIMRLWDTCQAEPDGFSELHLYVCCAFLKAFSKDVRARQDFQELMLFLQHLPTSNWREADMELVLAEAFVLKSYYHNATHHVDK